MSEKRKLSGSIRDLYMFWYNKNPLNWGFYFLALSIKESLVYVVWATDAYAISVLDSIEHTHQDSNVPALSSSMVWFSSTENQFALAIVAMRCEYSEILSSSSFISIIDIIRNYIWEFSENRILNYKKSLILYGNQVIQCTEYLCMGICQVILIWFSVIQVCNP